MKISSSGSVNTISKQLINEIEKKNVYVLFS